MKWESINYAETIGCGRIMCLLGVEKDSRIIVNAFNSYL